MLSIFRYCHAASRQLNIAIFNIAHERERATSFRG